MMYDFTRYGLFALFVLLLVFPFALWQFQRKPPAEAAILALMVPWMFGPNLAMIDLPFLPGFNKVHFAYIGAAAGMLLFARRRLAAAKPGRGIDIFILLMFFSDFMRFWTNRDPLWRGPTLQAGLTMQDAVYYIEEDLVSFGLPLLIGRACIRSRADAISALRMITILGMVYTPLILWEIRMSPQLHKQVYGYGMTYGFAQSMRDGGFRPEVFLQHGLILGMYVMAVAFTAVGLYKLGKKRLLQLPAWMVALGFLALAVLVKAKAALVFTASGAAILYRLRSRLQVLISVVLSLAVVGYASLHLSEEFPAEELLEQLEPFGEDRLQSMQFRLDNELSLVVRAKERLWFGWGGYSRERIYDEMGNDISVQDGAWIIVLGIRGLVGFAAFFGPLIGAILYALVRMRRLKDERDKRMIGVFAMITAMVTLNMLPNMDVPVLPFLCAGATVGLTSGLVTEQAKRKKQRRAARRAEAAGPGPGPRRAPYPEGPRPGGPYAPPGGHHPEEHHPEDMPAPEEQTPPPHSQPSAAERPPRPPAQGGYAGSAEDSDEEPSVIINMPINVR